MHSEGAKIARRVIGNLHYNWSAPCIAHKQLHHLRASLIHTDSRWFHTPCKE